MDLSKDTSVVDAAIAQKENRIAKLRRYGDELIQLGLKDFHMVLSQELFALEAEECSSDRESADGISRPC